MKATDKRTFETALERIRCSFALCVYGYVVMSEHIHLLMSAPEQAVLAKVKLSVAVKPKERPFWQARCYDFNVYPHHETPAEVPTPTILNNMAAAGTNCCPKPYGL